MLCFFFLHFVFTPTFFNHFSNLYNPRPIFQLFLLSQNFESINETKQKQWKKKKSSAFFYNKISKLFFKQCNCFFSFFIFFFFCFFYFHQSKNYSTFPILNSMFFLQNFLHFIGQVSSLILCNILTPYNTALWSAPVEIWNPLKNYFFRSKF